MCRKIWANTFVTAFPELPRGGFGLSGLGREFGPAGLVAYLGENPLQVPHHDSALEVAP